MDLQLRDKVFVVSAASSGLGAASAGALVAEGARVVLIARRATALADQVARFGADQAVALTADLADAGTAAAAVDLALDTWDRLDGTLISVGGPPAGGIFDVTAEQWSQAFDSVFLAAWRLAREVVTRGTADDLALGFVLSTSAKVPIEGLAISNGLRPGLAMLVKEIADRHGPQGVRAFGLLPGSVQTDRIRELMGTGGDLDAARAAASAKIPLRRMGDPAEFGRVAAFLLSPAASYVSGCLVPVDGGALRAL